MWGCVNWVCGNHTSTHLPPHPTPPRAAPPHSTCHCQKHRARGYTLEEEDVPPVAPWRGLGKSVFGGRPKENDSRAFTNRPGIERDIFDKDWLRANAKKRFGQLITKHCPGKA